MTGSMARSSSSQDRALSRLRQGCDSPTRHSPSQVAQLVERWPVTPLVAGASPALADAQDEKHRGLTGNRNRALSKSADLGATPRTPVRDGPTVRREALTLETQAQHLVPEYCLLPSG